MLAMYRSAVLEMAPPELESHLADALAENRAQNTEYKREYRENGPKKHKKK